MLIAFEKTIVEKMELKVAFKYSLKRSEKVKTLPPKISVKLGNKNEATVDSYLLFPRLVVLPNGSNISCDNCKRYEM